MPDYQSRFEDRVVGALIGEPLIFRLSFVRNLIFNRNGDPEDPDSDTVLASAVRILDEVMDDVSTRPDIARWPRLSKPPVP